MNRLEKKCFIGSATFHGLLLVVFLFGSAFLSSKQMIEIGPVIDMVNAKITDKPFNTGGNPNANESPAPAPQPDPPKPEPVKPEPIKPRPRPEPVKPVKIKEPEVKETGELPLKVTKPKTPDKDTTKSSLTQKVIKRSDTNLLAQIKRDADERARREKAEATRAAAEHKQLVNSVNDALNIGKSTGKSTVVDVQGPGGTAYSNYGSLVGEIYKRAVYATQPQSDEDAQAVINVIVSRNGSVRNSQWVRRTGNSVLDKAVDRAMNSVRSLPEFPPESKDSERSFNIRIAFEAKRVSA